jgi:ABC-2 type transport system ATP-binding protein
MKILTTYIASDEGTALVNGHNVTSDQKLYNFLSVIYLNTILCIWICMCRNHLAQCTDIYKELPNPAVSRKYTTNGQATTESHKKMSPTI